MKLTPAIHACISCHSGVVVRCSHSSPTYKVLASIVEFVALVKSKNNSVETGFLQNDEIILSFYKMTLS